MAGGGEPLLVEAGRERRLGREQAERARAAARSRLSSASTASTIESTGNALAAASSAYQ